MFTIETAGTPVSGGFSNLSTINAYQTPTGPAMNFPNAIATANGDVYTVTFDDMAGGTGGNGGNDNITLTLDATPEPGSLGLLGLGGLAMMRRRRKALGSTTAI